MSKRICHRCGGEVMGDDYACPHCHCVVMGGTPVATVTVARVSKNCGECGGPIEPDGPLTLCTRCAMSAGEDDQNRCENCLTPIPENKWVCDDCFPKYDGERFITSSEREEMKVNFNEVSITRTKSRKCGCGKRRTRTQKFFQTINPFNRTKDGVVKTREDIYRELEAEAYEWMKKPITCGDCEEKQ